LYAAYDKASDTWDYNDISSAFENYYMALMSDTIDEETGKKGPLRRAKDNEEEVRILTEEYAKIVEQIEGLKKL